MPAPPTAKRIEMWPLDRLVPYERNARTHSPEQIAQIAASIQEFGFTNPILVDGSDGILAGHGRLAAAKDMGLAEVPVIVLDHLSAAQRRAYILADNQLALNAGWDMELLQQEIVGLNLADFDLSLLGFDEDRIAGLLDMEVEELAPEDADADAVPEPPAEPITKPGDVWLLGKHRVMCGDSREKATWAQIMRRDNANVVFTSPPYASQRDYDKSSGFSPIPPDEYVAWWEPLQTAVAAHLASDGSFFVNIKEHCDDGQRHLYVKDLTIAHVRLWSWRFVDEFCWKRKGVPGGWDYRFKNEWEPVFHFSRAKPKCSKFDVGTEGITFTATDNASAKSVAGQSVFNCNGANGKVESAGLVLPGNVIEVNGKTEAEHNAAFPVGLPEFFIKAFSDADDVVVDPFLGSGTTLIAAEQQGRKCYGIEISPAYTDVIVNRWQRFTGKTATLEATGEPFPAEL
jgi:DNA modification methylase